MVMDPSEEEKIQGAHRSLLDTSSIQEAKELGRRLRERTPGLHPAIVLEAQALVVEERFRPAVELLRPVLDELPQYLAARLALARAEELQGDLINSLENYRVAAPQSMAAAEKVQLLMPRAMEILTNRLDDALARRRFEEAEESLHLLRIWSPESLATAEAALRVAIATEDEASELAAVRNLVGFEPDSLSLLERKAVLELKVGDASAGVDLFRRLVAESPDDSRLRGELARAEFLWRVSLLPKEVRDLTLAPELTRSDYAVLLYWLVPSVRYGRLQKSRIATDILDHPQRDAIARVINLGLMEVDETLHRFSPERSVTRSEVMSGILHLMEIQRQKPACMGPRRLGNRPSFETLCRTAAACSLLPSSSDCLPRASIAGSEVLDMVRLGLRQVGGA